MTVPHLLLQILSPVVNYSASSEMVRVFSQHYWRESSNSSAFWSSIGIRPHVYQRVPPIWLFNDCLHTYWCLFYPTSWIIPRRVTWFKFSFCIMEVKRQSHRYSEGRTASGTMFIRGFPLYRYFMALYTLYFANFIALCEMLRLEQNGWIFQSTICGWIIKMIGTQRVDRHQTPYISGVSRQTVI